MRGHGVAEATGVASDRNNLVLGVLCMVRWLLPRRRIEQASDMRKGSKRRSNDRMRVALEERRKNAPGEMYMSIRVSP
jgi:hypothetical protein